MKKSQNFKVIDDIGFYQQGVILNTQAGPLKDVRVRKAIAYAIDYEGILSTVFFGQAERLANPIPNGFPSYNASVPTLYSYNMDKAKALINEAGYSNGFGARFLIYGREDWVKIATIIQSSLSKLNIKVDIQQFAQSTYYTMRRQGQFDLCMQDWSPDYADPDNLVYPFYYSKNAGAPSNYSRYNSTTVDQLILNARTEYDQTKRFQMYSEIQKIIIDEAPIVWMLQSRGYRGLTLRSWVQGYTYNPVIPWSLPAELYKA
jgi:peptide/nickel transport system substrate-binding protein